MPRDGTMLLQQLQVAAPECRVRSLRCARCAHDHD